jgi:hypothetical protein
MLHHEIWYILTNISDELIAAIIRSLLMVAVSSSATYVNTYQATQCNIPEDSYFSLVISGTVRS